MPPCPPSQDGITLLPTCSSPVSSATPASVWMPLIADSASSSCCPARHNSTWGTRRGARGGRCPTGRNPGRGACRHTGTLPGRSSLWSRWRRRSRPGLAWPDLTWPQAHTERHTQQCRPTQGCPTEPRARARERPGAHLALAQVIQLPAQHGVVSLELLRHRSQLPQVLQEGIGFRVWGVPDDGAGLTQPGANRRGQQEAGTHGSS